MEMQAGKFFHNIICDSSITVPPKYSDRVFYPSVYAAHMAANAAAFLLRDSDLPPSKRTCLFIDRWGRYFDAVLGLVEVSNIVKVLTDAPDNYDDVEEKAFEMYGAGLIVSDEPADEETFDVVVAPEGFQRWNISCEGIPLFVGSPEYASQSGCYCRYELDAARWREYIPHGIDKLVMLGAFYELCGIRKTADIIPKPAKVQ